MYTDVTRRFTFEASHRLPDHPGKCRQPHGHSYKLFVTVGDSHSLVNPRGYFVDFDTLKEIVQLTVLDKLDHQDLNSGVLYVTDHALVPSAENIAHWIWTQLALALDGLPYKLRRIRLYETENCYVDVRG